MTCIYNNENHRCGGKCELYDTANHIGMNYKNSEWGFSMEDEGTCAVDNDPNPSKNCVSYESIDGEDEDEDE